MGMRIPPLKFKIMLDYIQSNPLKSRILVRRWAILVPLLTAEPAKIGIRATLDVPKP